MSLSASDSAMTPEQLEVLAVLENFLDGLNAADVPKMKALVLLGGGSTLRRDKEPKIQHFTMDGLIDKAIEISSGLPNFRETFSDPEVRIDGELALIWVKYEIFGGGKLIVEGRNAITLAQVDGKGWLMSGVADTGREVVS